ncbi:hypothetical protein JHK87_033711 [Glycine soja]|nr:hypothetical protein JHK87_033711 [Glycine soja]
MAAQFNAFLDSTEELCKTQQLSGKPVAIITGTNSQGGGQETTVLTGITPLVHHGMIFVPFGIRFTYSHEFWQCEGSERWKSILYRNLCWKRGQQS